MKTNDERLEELLHHLETMTYIKTDEIPNIDLYMDQVTTFMDEHLKNSKRYPDDKVLTKTMINNYAKNNLLPPPTKKKYSKEHILLLIFIYYFKNLLSFNDIEQLFRPLTTEHFQTGSEPSLETIYDEIFSLEKEQMGRLREDVRSKYESACQTFQDTEAGEREYLQLFAFICELSFDVYLKKQMIESLADELRAEEPSKKKKDGKQQL